MQICKQALYAALTIVTVMSSSSSARAQCHDWSAGFEVPGFTLLGGEGELNDLQVYDDGSEAALYAGGRFSTVEKNTVNALAKWDGSEWSPLGTGLSGLNSSVIDLAVYDGGSGPELIAVGRFTLAGGVSVSNIAKWNGTSWSALGTGLSGVSSPQAYDMTVFDDGSGSALYVCGDFTNAGGVSANHIAKWNGSSWSALGSGTSSPGVLALASFDDGSGPGLYACGYFNMMGGISADKLAKWNGTSWSAVTAAPNGTLTAMTVFDDGLGAALFVSGNFNVIGGVSANEIAKWDGVAWSALGSGLNGQGTAFVTFDDGSGSALFVAGQFTTAGGAAATRIAKWDGTNWSALGNGFNERPLTLTGFDDGSGDGPRLYAGGEFTSSSGTAVNHFARWDGAAWSLPSYGQGFDDETFPPPPVGAPSGLHSFAVYDDGAGPSLYAGGKFEGAGPVATHGIARWKGTRWSALADGVDGLVDALEVFDDGSGAALYAGGEFFTASGVTVNHIAKWNGTSWSALGDGFNYPVYDLEVFDDGTGNALYACGQFTSSPGILLKRVARWNGTTWSAVGNGTSGNVLALAVYDDGSGPALFAGGFFTDASGTSASNIAKWNGSTWSALGSGINSLGTVYALAAFDDGLGGGTELYAGGFFTNAGGVSVSCIAKWNGSAWSSVGTGTSSRVNHFHVFDDGGGARLYAGGTFTTAGGIAANRVAAWDGVTWSALGTGVSSHVEAIADYDDGSGGGSELYVGGIFSTAGGKQSTRIARFGACRPGTGYCFGDDLDPFVTSDCPCANVGDPGHGCANSIFASGGLLTATGTTSPNTVLFTMSQVPNNALATGFSNVTNTNPGGVVFGDGVRCQSGALVRFGSHNAGTLGDAPNTWSASAFPIAPGLTRYYQIQYRNSAPAFCPPATFNISNGYRISW